MPKLIVLGNCMAERIAVILAKAFEHPESGQSADAEKWLIVPARPVYCYTNGARLNSLAQTARSCDLVLSQPLFNYGPCNTEMLLSSLGNRLKLFSAPNFAAYFPDALPPFPYLSAPIFPTPLEWHSSIFIDCRLARIPGERIEEFYLNHPIFQRNSIRQRIQQSLKNYAKRDANVHISTYDLVKTYYAKELLFHTCNHPGDRIISHIIKGILTIIGWNHSQIDHALSLVAWEDSASTRKWSPWGFGFNAWPVICGKHTLFSFPSREFFRIGGKEYDILTVALAYYKFYDKHPCLWEQAVKWKLFQARSAE